MTATGIRGRASQHFLVPLFRLWRRAYPRSGRGEHEIDAAVVISWWTAAYWRAQGKKICGSPRITGSWIPRAPTKGFRWHLHVGSSANSLFLIAWSRHETDASFLLLLFLILEASVISCTAFSEGNSFGAVQERKIWPNKKIITSQIFLRDTFPSNLKTQPSLTSSSRLNLF